MGQSQVDGFGHSTLFPAIVTREEEQSHNGNEEGWPRLRHVQLELRRNTSDEEVQTHYASPEGHLKQDHACDMAEDAVCALFCHGRLRKKR